MSKSYLPIRFMNAIEQRDSKITDLLNAQLPEYLENEERIDLERILVLLPYADEAHIKRWEKSLGIMPGSDTLEGRRRYLITLITTKIKPSTKTIEEMSYSFTGRHADVFMNLPKSVEMGIYISGDSEASSSESYYHWINGNRIKNIRSMLLGYESEGIVKDVHDYFSEHKDRSTIYRVHDDELFSTDNQVWLLGDQVIDTVEQISTEQGDMFVVTVEGKECIVPKFRERYINIAFADEMTTDVNISDEWGLGYVDGDVYYDDNPTDILATFNVEEYAPPTSMFTDIAFDVCINKDEILNLPFHSLRGLGQLRKDNGNTGIEYNNRYIHIAYADNATGTANFTLNDSNRLFIGVAYDFNLLSSNLPSAYRWHRISDLVPGVGIQITADSYLHITWSDSAHGIINNSKTQPGGKQYIGLRVDGSANYVGALSGYKYFLLTDEPPYKPNLLVGPLMYTPHKTEVGRNGFWRYYYSIPSLDENMTLQIADGIDDFALKNMALHIAHNMSYTYAGQKYVGLYIFNQEYTNLDYTKYHWQTVPSNGTLTDGEQFVHIAWKHEFEPMIPSIVKPVQNIKRNIIFIRFQGELPQLSYRRYVSYLRSVIPAHLDFVITFGDPMDIALYPYVYHGTHVSVLAFD